MFLKNYRKEIGVSIFSLFILLAVFSFVVPTKTIFACEKESLCEDSESLHKPPCTNTPPSINLIGDNPLNLTVGDTFTDPGATATDKEDGNMTSHIVVSGTVDTSIVGTYVITYEVTDSGGLMASTIRMVDVYPKVCTSDCDEDNSFDITVVATKIVCDSESDLPNWGLGGPDITASTANDFLSTHPNCHLTPNWNFQWADSTATDPGKSFVGEAGGWNTFGPTGEQGVVNATISISSTTPYLWVREVLKSGYLPFAYPGDNDPASAEMYCHTDVLNYDNYDRVDGLFVSGGTYYCVAFNVLDSVPPTNTPPAITLIGANPFNMTVGNVFTDPGATATDLEDGDATTTSHIIVTGTVSTSTVGTYTLTYSVTDSGGLSASTTRTVNVNDQDVPHTPSLSLTANPQTITLGVTSTLTWSSQNVSSCSAVWTLATSTSGSAIVSPATTTDYVMTCTGTHGNTKATSTVTVSPVNPPANTPPTITLIGANPFNMTVGNVFTDPGATATDLEDGDATTTSHIIVTGTVSTSTVGTYILTYTVTDSGGLSASTTRTVIVNATTTPPINPPVNPSSGGGGGGVGGHRHPIVVGEILGVNSCSYLLDYLKIGWQNDPIEVLKLQSFLNIYEKENLPLTGVFGQDTFAAVQRFQTKYSNDILQPWGPNVTTGFVYILTKKKINEIYCNTNLSLSQNQQDEINSFKSSGMSVFGGVGQSDNNSDKGQNIYLLNDKSNQGKGTPVVYLTSSSSNNSVVKNLAVSMFALPSKIFGNWKYFLIFLILVAIIVAIVRLFRNSPDDDDNVYETPTESGEETFVTNESEEAKESPTIILPGFTEDKKETLKVLPDEELIIENPEEEEEEGVIKES